MLSLSEIENLILNRLPEPQAREILLQLSPESIDKSLLGRFVQVMRSHGPELPDLPADILDCCGTGGSGLSRFNTSTTVSFILASGGVKVVKFGNRAITSQSGSFDLLEHLGFPTTYPIQAIPEILEKSHLAFLFAPHCYPAFSKFNQLRRTLGTKTIFNFLGPLLNPVNPSFRILGVSHPEIQSQIAQFLSEEGQLKKGLVIHGENGLDEIDCFGPSRLYQVEPNQFSSHQFLPDKLMQSEPETFPFQNNPEENGFIFHRLVTGQDVTSIYYRMVCLNAGAGFYVAGKSQSIEEGARFSADLLRGGKVLETLNDCRSAYAQYSG